MRFRKTKLIATIGPACENPALIRELIEAGMNVARLNLSHETPDDHARRARAVRKVAEECGSNVALMADTKGLEIRTGAVQGGAVLLSRGDRFKLNADYAVGDMDGVSVSNPGLAEHVAIGDQILLDDGRIDLRVTGIDSGQVECRVECGGTLRNRKSVSFPNIDLVRSALAPEIGEDLAFAAENDVEYLAASFVQSSDDVQAIRSTLLSLDSHIPIIAKIENRRAVQNLEEIVDVADGAMVARGDLGVALPVQELPGLQKRIIRTTVGRGKPVITATQMLDSMERNPRPTRAEASDVANAIYDGTSAVMLSGETAAGLYPIESVRTMSAIALEAEESLDAFGILQNIRPNPSNVVTEAVSQAAIAMSAHLSASAIVAVTETGFTARMISKYRPHCPIIAVTTSNQVVRELAMNWGVWPLHADGSDEERVRNALDRAREFGLVSDRDVVVATGGISHRAGATNMIRVLTV